MESIRFFNACVVWTRSIVLILSIIIVISSLSIYNYDAIPVFLLLEEDASSLVLKGHEIIYDMIQDRRLIATLVAAQASIFCPLFLLMSASSTAPSICQTTADIWRTVIEQFCQFLMPLGLALSWIFCITFDTRTQAALMDQNMKFQLDQDHYTALATYIGNSLKYVIIVILLLEVVTIWVSSFKYATILFISHHQQAIRLQDDDSMYTSLDNNEEEQQLEYYSSNEEKILFI
ncbi:hypothetical protein INT47_009010 [Mucor saturninus]|uniref:Uncharacterized protein n=1 Tax=Mucor saturninus TaxID=64648 RepID=A0A8H7QVB3_9FUNG|nr:hypothetical protein INT47_009010 [Mucor saturninus]